jgi:ABC-type sugar transport system ATPase subunit
MTVAFCNVTKTFPDGTTALDRFDLRFDPGEFVVLLGPSGCGKSTACRILAGLEVPTSGTVEVGGADITQMPPRARNMSMVFQSYALYPHKTVFENIAYPLRVRRTPKAEIDHAVKEMAAMLQIERLLARRPRQLSGGEAQRVAVARALVWRPQICLMDEPLSNLDALLRLKTRIELKRIHAELQKTFVFVTHDQEEALSLGTRIARSITSRPPASSPSSSASPPPTRSKAASPVMSFTPASWWCRCRAAVLPRSPVAARRCWASGPRPSRCTASRSRAAWR